MRNYPENVGKYPGFQATGLLVLGVKLLEIHSKLISRYTKKNTVFFSFEEKSHEPHTPIFFFLGGMNDEYYERMRILFPSKCIVFLRKFGEHIRRHFPYHLLWLFKFCFQRVGLNDSCGPKVFFKQLFFLHHQQLSVLKKENNLERITTLKIQNMKKQQNHHPFFFQLGFRSVFFLWQGFPSMKLPNFLPGCSQGCG